MTGWYLLAILVSLASMVAIDHRWRLFWWADARRAAIVHLAGIVFFLAWDVAAISRGLFERGQGSALTGIEIAPHLPIEEIFFVTFLCYLTMNVYGLVSLRLAERDEAAS